MTVKRWVAKTQKTLIVQGTKLDEKAETPVAMITTDIIMGEFETPIEDPTKGTEATINVSKTGETEETKIS